MAEETKIQLPPPQIITPSLLAPQKKKMERKHLIWATSAVAVVLLLVAGFSLGGYFFTRTTRQLAKQYHLQFKSKEDGGLVDETIDNNVQDNTQLFHMHTPTGQQWVLKDYTRDIEVYKITEEGEMKACYVAPLNRTQGITPKKLDEDMADKAVNSTDDDNTDGEDTDETYYSPSADPISDPSYLGPKVKDMCANMEVYWIFTTCGRKEGNTTDEIPESDIAEDGTDGTRMKRSCSYYPYCYTYTIRITYRYRHRHCWLFCAWHNHTKVTYVTRRRCITIRRCN